MKAVHEDSYLRMNGTPEEVMDYLDKRGWKIWSPDDFPGIKEHVERAGYLAFWPAKVPAQWSSGELKTARKLLPYLSFDY